MRVTILYDLSYPFVIPEKYLVVGDKKVWIDITESREIAERGRFVEMRTLDPYKAIARRMTLMTFRSQ